MDDHLAMLALVTCRSVEASSDRFKGKPVPVGLLEAAALTSLRHSVA
ncbi:MAG: hypothetical protein ACR2PN_04155 [Luminiphilus sp.]